MLPTRMADQRQAAILVVDDEPSVRELVREVLAREGYTVLQAASPRQALEVVRRRAGGLDLLVTDMTMPGMDGTALARELRADYPQLAALFMSGSLDETPPPPGADGRFLQKPFSIDRLIVEVRAALRPAE